MSKFTALFSRQTAEAPQDEAAQQWRQQLGEYIATCRAREPLRSATEFTPREQRQLGVARSGLLAQLSDRTFSGAKATMEGRGGETNRVVVLLLDRTGILAANTLLKEGYPNTYYLTPEEWRQVPESLRDPDFKYHLRLYNYFAPVTGHPAYLAQAAKQFPAYPPEEILYRLVGGEFRPRTGSGRVSLWRDGPDELTLLVREFTYYPK